jgi:hypothetical protein
MPTSLIDADSLLAIDVGDVTTRAMLFDVVDGRYRFLAHGAAPTTAGAPFKHIGEGVRQALDALQAVTGRRLVGANEELITPSAPDGSGVDQIVATLSAGPVLKVIVAGLLEDISLESARQLAAATYAQVVGTFSLNDRRKLEDRLSTLLHLRPDLIIVAGGTDGGASQSVLKLLEPIELAGRLLPEGQRPEVLFTGNEALKDEVARHLEANLPLHFAANVRPSLDIEQLEPAQIALADLYRAARSRQIPGVQELNALVGGGLLPTATALGRVIRYLSKALKPDKGVMGIDVGASATTLAASYDGELTLGVYPQQGLGRGVSSFAQAGPLSDVMRWLPVEVAESYVLEYLYTKALYPASLPGTPEDLAIECALARQAIRTALRKSAASFPNRWLSGSGQNPVFDPILASGSVLTRLPKPAHSLLTLLDGIQPSGVTTLVLDQNHLIPALGAAAAVNPILAVQVLESNTFLNLGTVITPVSGARSGTPVLRLRMKDEAGNETSYDIKQGRLEMLPLPLGKTAQLRLQPLSRSDVGMGGPGKGGSLKVTGGVLGVVIDARGRPLRLPPDPAKRRDLLQKWLWMLGG